MLRVEARVKRLFLLGGLTLAIGLAAVLGAIVFRLGKGSVNSPPPAAMVDVPAAFPKGARLVGTANAGDRIVLSYEVGTDTLLVFVDPKIGAVTGQAWLRPEH